MNLMNVFFEEIRKTVEKQGINFLRISVGIIFFWFGFLKFFGNISDAEEIASRTISWLTFDFLKPEISMPVLAVMECTIGIGILSKKYMEYVIPLLYFQMVGTLLPLLIFREATWKITPIVPTLLGQYIIKNAILISAGIVLGAIAKGAKLINDPVIAETAKHIEKKKENNG